MQLIAETIAFGLVAPGRESAFIIVHLHQNLKHDSLEGLKMSRWSKLQVTRMTPTVL